jgi:predicted AlkP superfamily phosphohydrolase/phosphomutase
MVFTGPDKVQHFFWKDMDLDHPGHDPALSPAFAGNILDLWKKQDAILGEMLDALPPDATVLMLSDHGFEAIYRQVNLANWVGTTDLPEWLQDHAIPPLLITNGILHYILEGQLAGASDREEFLDRFIARCRELRDPATGLVPFENLFRREEIYSGRMLEKAPDLVFQEVPRYFVTRGAPDSLDLPIFQDVWTTSFSAHHRPEGILAVVGPSICRPAAGDLRTRLAGGGDFREAKILDVAPTLLALMNQIIPDLMDGRVLEEAVCPEFLAAHPPRTEPVEGFLLDRLPPSKLSPEEREKMKALPYIN